MRLIDADALNLDYEVEMADDWKTAHEIANVVKYAPTVDAVPVVRGKWQDVKGNLSWFYQCSECGVSNEYKTNFCKHCGADMRGEKDE
jgi:rRNA maturation endonuclease Nob1